MAILNRVVRGVAAGVGLASESISAYNAQRRNETPNSTATASTTEEPDSSEENTPEHSTSTESQLELQWELDEAQDELNNGVTNRQDSVTTEQLAESFLRRYPSPQECSSNTPQCLPYPVVIPQRRPKSRKRGFIRAYAPVLQDLGIDQTTFIDFIDTANASCQGSPWLHAINLASIGTFFIPSPTAMAVSAMISTATQVAITADGRRKSNAFFDQINENFFHPRGLHCLVMTWKPESAAAIATFDLNSAIATSTGQGDSGMRNKLKHVLKSSDATTYGTLPCSETAPLVFPDLDELEAHGSEAQAKLKTMKTRKEFVEDYWDRRERAKFMVENPQCDLNQGPQPEFTSRYANPTHPASSGSLLGLVTGGHVTREDIRQRRESTRRDSGFRRRAPAPVGRLASRAAYRSGPGEITTRTSRRRRAREGDSSQGDQENRRGCRQGPVAGIQKLLQSDMLYLMIVNMPTEEEMAVARDALQPGYEARSS
ncbi:hypothetical protein BJX96DRAFT_75710 [Aspergillus floccosus]